MITIKAVVPNIQISQSHPSMYLVDHASVDICMTTSCSNNLWKYH